jgi:hypothetical protein
MVIPMLRRAPRTEVTVAFVSLAGLLSLAGAGCGGRKGSYRTSLPRHLLNDPIGNDDGRGDRAAPDQVLTSTGPGRHHNEWKPGPTAGPQRRLEEGSRPGPAGTITSLPRLEASLRQRANRVGTGRVDTKG